MLEGRQYVVGWMDDNRRGVIHGSELHVDTVTISVHRHIDFKDKAGNFNRWLLTSRKLGIDKHLLKAVDLECAKAEALVVVFDKLRFFGSILSLLENWANTISGVTPC